MRIVAGRWGGRKIDAPRGQTTRPTSDRVREALFSSLEASGAVSGAVVLDAFAGTGALALEALSRGASRAVLVERDAAALRSLKDNVASLGASAQVRIVVGDVLGGALGQASGGGPYSLLFLDPPYRIGQSVVRELIDALETAGSLADTCTIVWEHATGTAPEWPVSVSPVRDRRYGDTTVSIAMRVEGEGR